MQFQADVAQKIVDRPVESESTALGAAYLCEIALGIRTVNEIASSRKTQKLFTPDENSEKYEKLYEGWQNAVKRCLV